MPTNALAATSLSQGCAQTEQLARQWAITFAELFCVSLEDRGPRFVDLWASALADLAPEALDAACRRAMQVCKFFPTPAEIRAQIQQADDKGLQLEAEQTWQQYLGWVGDWFVPDLGVMRGAPTLLPAVEHAARVAGGHRWVEDCPDSELQWARKRFVEAYMLVQETRQVEHLLTSGEAKHILAQLSKPPERKRLPQAPSPPPESDAPSDSRTENSGPPKAVIPKFEPLPPIEAEDSQPPLLFGQPYQPPSEEELVRRAQDQKQRLQAHLAMRAQSPGGQSSPTNEGCAADREPQTLDGAVS